MSKFKIVIPKYIKGLIYKKIAREMLEKSELRNTEIHYRFDE